MIKTKEEIQAISQSCVFAKTILADLLNFTQIGVNCLEIENKAKEIMVKMGVESGSLGENGFPGHICLNINNEVVHGVPKNKILKSGDIVNVDVVVKHNGYYGDCAHTKLLGCDTEYPKRAELISIANKSLLVGIQETKIGNKISDIGLAINSLINQYNGYKIVDEYSGHGIGTKLHEWPCIEHTYNSNDELIAEDMVFTIEPIIVNRMNYRLFTDIDKHTIYTASQILSAHFEHTLHITKEGPVILT